MKITRAVHGEIDRVVHDELFTDKGAAMEYVSVNWGVTDWGWVCYTEVEVHE